MPGKEPLIDLPKVSQMLDGGWMVTLRKCRLGSYVAEARTENPALWHRAKRGVFSALRDAGWDEETAGMLNDNDFDEPGVIHTDDFTPEGALTRLAYKVQGEVLP